MSRELCLLHANCQGVALKQLLEASPGFASRFEIKYVKNYEKTPLAPEWLDRSGLFLYQYLGKDWGDLASNAVLQSLSPKSRHMCIPNCFFKGYWPLWRIMPGKRDFADALLESLFDKGLSDAEILRIYLTKPHAMLGDVEQDAQDSLKVESAKETYTSIKYVDFIRERWRQEQVFITVNHPGAALLIHIAQEILRQLELAPIPESFASAWKTPYNAFWLPIHPVVGQILNLPFATEGRRYPAYGATLNFCEYICVYLACQRNGIVDIASALASHANTSHKVKS